VMVGVLRLLHGVVCMQGCGWELTLAENGELPLKISYE